MAKFFMRNHPTTIKDAQEMELQDFVYKYKETLTTEEVLSAAYYDIRRRHPVQQPEAVEQRISSSKAVTFKVIKVTPKFIEPPPILEEKVCETDTKKSRIRLTPEQTIARDKRIKELLDQGKIAREIIEIMAGEGVNVHAPQVTAVKNK